MSHRYSFFDSFSSGSGFIYENSPPSKFFVPDSIAKIQAHPDLEGSNVSATSQIEEGGITSSISLFAGYKNPPVPLFSSLQIQSQAPINVTGSAEDSLQTKEETISSVPSFPSTLEIEGQGTVSVNADASVGFHVAVKTRDPLKPNLYLDVTTDSCTFTYGGPPALEGGNIPVGKREKILAVYPKGENASYLVGPGPYKHWLSIDRENGKLRYGRGYCSASLILLEATVKVKTGEDMVYTDIKWSWLANLVDVTISQTGISNTSPLITVDRFPLVRDLPPYVVKDEMITLSDLEDGVVTVVANLPQACQQLYRNVAGPSIALDSPDFLDFSKAIEHSLKTKGLLGNMLLEKKANLHGFSKKDFLSTYLRITIGTNLGNSPGVPYVLEIWPAGHHSPIHDHAGSFAVIKVLHGDINAYYFDSLAKPGPNQLGSPAKLTKGDVTWISNKDYQVHQLKNESTTMCCTIQCYQYGEEDNKHAEYFKYLTEEGEGEFTPNSDMTFSEFKSAIKEEWESLASSLP